MPKREPLPRPDDPEPVVTDTDHDDHDETDAVAPPEKPK